MNIFRLRFTIYILLAAFAMQKFSHEAGTAPNSNLSIEEITEDINLVATNNAVKPTATKLNAQPQALEPQPFSGERGSNSKERQESRGTDPSQKIFLPTRPLKLSLSGIEVRQFIQTRLSSTSSQPSPPATRETADTTTSAALPGSETLPVPSLPPVVQQAPPTHLLASVSSHNARDLQGISTLDGSAMLLSSGNTPFDKETITPEPRGEVVTQGASTQSQLEEVQPFAGERGSHWAKEQGSNEFLAEPLTMDSYPSLPVTRETLNGTTSAALPAIESLPVPSLLPVDQQPPLMASANLLTAIPSHSARELQEILPQSQGGILPKNSDTPPYKETINSQPSEEVVAQGTSIPSRPDVEKLQNELRSLEEIPDEDIFQASPGLSIAIPTGFGADRNTGFISATYQQRTRDISGLDDGGLGIGVGLGDARRAVGVELSYTTASFGNSRDFGSGGFNIKVHRQLRDDLAVAVGWNGFLNIGDDHDFEDTLYGVGTKVFRTREDINLPFSRVAVSVGIGNGQFRTEGEVADDETRINAFGNIAVRIAQPVSLIAEWSGQDLGVGLSIAPFKNIPLVITPAVRDLAGAGDEPRFVLGAGFGFKF